MLLFVTRLLRRRDACCSVHEPPVPGMPTVSRVLRGPMVSHARRRPNEIKTPDFDRFRRHPGDGDERRKRRPMGGNDVQYTGPGAETGTATSIKHQKSSK